jgi:hypothetical protein
MHFLVFYQSHTNLSPKFAANYTRNNLVGFLKLLRNISVGGVQRVANENKIH